MTSVGVSKGDYSPVENFLIDGESGASTRPTNEELSAADGEILCAGRVGGPGGLERNTVDFGDGIHGLDLLLRISIKSALGRAGHLIGLLASGSGGPIG